MNDTNRERIELEKLYTFKCVVKLVCKKNHESSTTEYRIMPILNFQNYGDSNEHISLHFYTLLDQYVNSEYETEWRCTKQGCNIPAAKSKTITFVNEMPALVIFNLARFKYDNEKEAYFKNTDVVYLTLAAQNLSALNVNKNDIYYNCIAIICHVGHDLSSGHYEAYTFENHKWMLYNDLMRQQVDINDA